MPNTAPQASPAAVIDAGLVRIAELGKHLCYLRQNHQPTDKVVKSIIDLRQKLEALALSTDPIEQVELEQYVQETYGLLGIETDPLLRALLPPIPVAGAEIHHRVLSINGRVVRINTHLIDCGAYLVAVVPPVVI